MIKITFFWNNVEEKSGPLMHLESKLFFSHKFSMTFVSYCFNSKTVLALLKVLLSRDLFQPYFYF